MDYYLIRFFPCPVLAGKAGRKPAAVLGVGSPNPSGSPREAQLNPRHFHHHLLPSLARHRPAEDPPAAPDATAPPRIRPLLPAPPRSPTSSRAGMEELHDLLGDEDLADVLAADDGDDDWDDDVWDAFGNGDNIGLAVPPHGYDDPLVVFGHLLCDGLRPRRPQPRPSRSCTSPTAASHNKGAP